MPESFPDPLLLGHRGSPRAAPENTLRSFVLALDEGADGVELDVLAARDGVPVVIHDGTLERTFGAEGEVAGLAWEALARLTRAQLPSLEQVAAWAASRGAWLNVELKAPGVEAATLAVLEHAGVAERTLFSSFHPAAVAEVGRLAPGAARYLLTERWDAAARDAARGCGAQGICLRVDAATPPALDALAAEGLPVVVWTVNEAARMRELLDAGVAGLITDLPALGAAVRREWRGE